MTMWTVLLIRVNVAEVAQESLSTSCLGACDKLEYAFFREGDESGF